MRKLILIAIAGIAAITIIPLAPASSATAPVARQDDIIPWFGCCDIYTYTPVLRSTDLNSEGDVRIQFRMRVYNNVEPETFRMSIGLWKYRGPFRRSALVDVYTLIKHDLPRPGKSRQKTFDFYCRPGRYFIKATVVGIPRGGTLQVARYFFPWDGFRKFHPKAGNQNKAPKPYEMWKTKCKGRGDTLVG